MNYLKFLFFVGKRMKHLSEELGIAALGNYCLLTPRDLPKVTCLMQRGFSFPSESDQCGKAQRSVNQPPNLDQANRIPLYKTGVVEWFFCCSLES